MRTPNLVCTSIIATTGGTMPREPKSKYFWPASAITESHMALLYRVRQASPNRTPITQLIARAVRETYGTHASELAHQLCKAA